MGSSTTTVPNGSHTIEVSAIDQASNLGGSSPITINVSNGTPPPPPVLNSLIPNPSVEIIGANNDPTSWFRGGWGNNTRVFSVLSYPPRANPNSQYCGDFINPDNEKTAKIVVTNFVDGDAKWYFSDIPIGANKNFTLSHWYRSGNTPTQLMVRYLLNNGTYTYIKIADLDFTIGSGGCQGADFGKNVTHTFIAPSNAISMTLYNKIFSNGFLEVDKFVLVPTASLVNVSITNSTNTPSQSIGVNVPNQILGGFTTTISGESISIGSMKFSISTTSTGSGLITQATIVDENGIVHAGPVDATFDSVSGKQILTFNDTVTISIGTKTFRIRGRIPSTFASGGTIQVSSTPSSDWTNVVGLTSGNIVSLSGSSLFTMSPMTVLTGSLTIGVDTSTPFYTLVSGGATGVNMGVIKMRAVNESINLNKVGLKLTSGLSTDLIQVNLYHGATHIGTAMFTGGNTTATSTLSSPLFLPNNSDISITIKADLSSIGISQPGTQGALVKVDPLNAEGFGISSGNSIQAGSATAGVNGVRMFKSLPILFEDTLSSTGIADGRLMRFKVTANSAGSVGVAQIKFTLSTTTASVTNIQLFAYTDSSYSSPVSGQGTSGQVGGTVATAINGTAFTMGVGTSPVQVSQGSTIYFELKGSVSNVQSGSSVVATLLGDSSYTSNLTTGFNVATSGAATSTGNFVWSGNATSTSGVHDIDWSNGYVLPGLPSAGFIKTRSQ
ncbi:MAG: hypothetical protein WAX44_03980 [Minisyncoccia bacterium]